MVQPEGNYTDKYHTKNPVSRLLMHGFLSSFDSLVSRTRAQTAYEFGCGEGNLSVRLAQSGLRVRGSDIGPNVVREAYANANAAAVSVDFQTASIYHVSPDAAAAELVVCCEVLEHLERPADALSVLARAARPWLLVSVPREPVWRILNLARGSYCSDLGNTPGHVQHWSTKSFIAFLSTCVDVVEIRRPLPWTMALCRSRTSAAHPRGR